MILKTIPIYKQKQKSRNKQNQINMQKIKNVMKFKNGKIDLNHFWAKLSKEF